MSHDDKVNELIERVRFICVKGGVRPEIMGALCHAIRYDDTNAAPREITAEVSSPVLGEFGEVPQSEGTHTHPVPTREANAARGAAPVVTHSAVRPTERDHAILRAVLCERADAVNLARHLNTVGPGSCTPGGIRKLCETLLRVDEALLKVPSLSEVVAPSASAPSNGLDAYNARDAARYRFLHHVMRMTERQVGGIVLRWWWDAPNGSSVFFEEAIDAAMAATEGAAK